MVSTFLYLSSTQSTLQCCSDGGWCELAHQEQLGVQNLAQGHFE